ncbi:hypothetical protein BGZ73_005260 [Actinomortierella ambigua]|nr:hypothetical protein BGZ73_005260 [Actinomortierella ambigua]
MTYSSTAARFLRIVRFTLIIYSTLVFGGLVYLTTRGFMLPNGETVNFLQVPVRSSCCLWTVFPSYRLNTLRRHTATTGSFFDNWMCGSVVCRILVAIDIASYLIAIFGLAEVYIADRYEAPYLYGKQSVANTTIILAPVVTTAPNPYQPIEVDHTGYQPYPQQQPVANSPYYPQSGYQPVHSAPQASSGYY